MADNRPAKNVQSADRALREELEAKNLALTREVAERKQVMALLEYKSRLLEEKEEFLRDIIEDQTELICRFTSEGGLTFANGAYMAHTGIDPDSLSGGVFPLCTGEEAREFARKLAEMPEDSPSAAFTAPLASPSGGERWIQWQIRPLGRSVFQAVGRDVTQTRTLRLALEETNLELEQRVLERTREFIRKNEELAAEVRERINAEQRARDKEQLLSAILDGIQAAFIILETESNTVVSCNPAAEEMFGLTPGEMVGHDCREVLKPKFGKKGKDVCALGSGPASRQETYLIRKSGTRIPVDRFTFPVGKARQAVILFDLTERKNLERQLNVAQKMESIGLLASGIAHEINTPIQFTGDSVRFMREAFEDLMRVMEARRAVLDAALLGQDTAAPARTLEELEEEVDFPFIVREMPRACDRALDGVARVAVIVQAMKNFAHPGMEEKKPVNLAKAIANTATIAKNEWKYVADMALNLPDDLPMVECLPGDMNQVFLNIIVNAAHAIRDVVGESGRKGTISVSARHTDASVTINISDTGTGIPGDNIDKIYDPFFTTKEIGKGTGQGLAIVHDIVVNKHGGTIDVESNPGRGTTFIVTVPVKADAQG